ncbi:MAG: phosphatidylserine/phosphatidylglycerophosphate/cardiolipin synthase family protein [Chloroflexi bacterium]|nr:phosphatidylserine/phosphatidylglycerophosphate/cardiolipin synthase family protein [Chloroflexota bacterium]
MLPSQVRTVALDIRWMYVHRRRLALRVIGILVLAQMFTLAVLTVVSELRKRRTPNSGFPRRRFEEIEVDGNRLQLYCSGTYLFQDMLDAIDGATRSILFETYLWKGDTLGQEFKDRLAAKAASGVDVYAIYDSPANLVVPREFKRFPPSIHTLRYGSIGRPWQWIDPRRYARDHRKLLVVDGETAFIGGYNIGELYRVQWRDTHVRVKGPHAARLGQDFIDFWNRHTSASERIPWNLRRGVQPRLQHSTNDARRLMFPIRDMYVDAIGRAERRVWITTAYFIPDTVLRNALIDAAKRGVDVKVLVPWTSNHVSADWLAHGFFSRLLEHGVRIFGYRDAMNHAKTMTVDGEWSTVGTANLDRLSQIGNYEINLEVYDEAFAAQMEQLFEIDRSNSFEVTLDYWHSRPWFAKIGELILAPLRPLL